MLPLFKSHYSIGKSILTLSPPQNCKEGGSDSIFQICEEEGLERLILVEDSPIGFLEAKTNAEKLGCQLIFGLRFKVSSFNKPTEKDDSIHKIIIFARDDKGCILLNKIYSEIHCEHKGIATPNCLKKLWDDKHLKLCIPFYDSFLYYNTLNFANCMPDFSFCSPTFFIERNKLPFDNIVEDKVLNYCKDNNYDSELTKTIYYKFREDIEAYQTYKCVCNRSFGRARSLSNPRFDHLGSREFCFESWKESVNE